MMIPNGAALIVVDVQKGFDDEAHWGPRNNPECERNIQALADRWSELGYPLVFVRHDSRESGSPLRPGCPGNALQDFLSHGPSLLVTKSVNSAFYGLPDLHEWLTERQIRTLVICGATTNFCCETTARMAGNLGYDVRFVLDATFTHAHRALDGSVISADEMARVSAANLNGEFAEIVSTEELLVTS